MNVAANPQFRSCGRATFAHREREYDCMIINRWFETCDWGFNEFGTEYYSASISRRIELFNHVLV